ncbi:hypothetical protein HPB51_013525 [Rhipicephalus microplus]|uniref:Uncharacterized protein n=1 Tax=Rhipicephalus microplus TaxID=6941 RepID=A0A9J6EST6_RHIMP|nr:hypothetical protein HPB51_013525 [Rhipicephalus microplus]
MEILSWLLRLVREASGYFRQLAKLRLVGVVNDDDRSVIALLDHQDHSRLIHPESGVAKWPSGIREVLTALHTGRYACAVTSAHSNAAEERLVLEITTSHSAPCDLPPYVSPQGDAAQAARGTSTASSMAYAPFVAFTRVSRRKKRPVRIGVKTGVRKHASFLVEIALGSQGSCFSARVAMKWRSWNVGWSRSSAPSPRNSSENNHAVPGLWVNHPAGLLLDHERWLTSKPDRRAPQKPRVPLTREAALHELPVSSSFTPHVTYAQ